MTHRVEGARSEDENELRALWNACRADSHPLSERALRQNLDGAGRTGRVASLVVRDQGRPVGWALARAHFAAGAAPAEAAMLAGTGKGSLSVLCVAPAARGQGIGRALLAAAEVQLRAWDVATATTAIAPFHFVPGVPTEAPDLDRLLARNGWEHLSDQIDLDGDVSNYAPNPDAMTRRAANPEVDLRPLRPGEEAALAAFMSCEFPGIWQFIIADHLAAGGAHDDVMVAVEGGRILGFAQVHDARSRFLAGSTLWAQQLGDGAGGLGPIGVAKDARKRGLGLALLDAALQHQRRRGVRRMVIDWTTLEAFYNKVGFSAWRRYTQRQKALL